VQRATAGQSTLPEDEWIKLFKLPAEPSRLESLLISGQIGTSCWVYANTDQYCKQIDNYASSSMMKMFATKGMPVVD
jgi:translation initiation factor 3 subunit H